ncbi:phage tail sheath family protein [Actinomycetospora termitidis]|uniref:Phage tail sheath subtilisin-like domain-containing protein n=1 Tax=Actinomycetospora termitidis TaxID=3053470 RepID=A0ABT7M7C5_9PSEU|nr:phage tail sheath subtilisin-like domain-containing protein [Actinomycetospora sp. Odt1-22]MDL5156574.1 phage tail sheath subtilisin-like domain-containing protein [Actinomycetospora sp. Odt1-22]
MPTYLSPGVYVQEVEPSSRPIEGVGTAVAAFVGFAETGPVNAPQLVTNWSQYTRLFGEFVDGMYLAHAVYGFFQNGGGSCYVVRVGSSGDPSSNGRGDGRARSQGRRSSSRPAAESSQTVRGGFRFGVRTDGDGAGEVTLEFTAVEGEDVPPGSFGLLVKRGNQTVESYERLTVARGDENVVTVLTERSGLITVEEIAPGVTTESPEPGSVTLGPDAPAAPTPARLEPGDFAGDVGERTGMGGLAAIEEITMVAAPDLMSAHQRGVIDDDGVRAVQRAMVDHCEQMGDRVAILDPPPALSAQGVRSWLQDDAGIDSKYAALYYPWIQVQDPASGGPTFIPPSGHLAGIWARNDDTRGVHKAPGNEIIRGATGLQLGVTRGEQDLLNPIGVNCLRGFPGRGLRVWGARTLSSDPAWRYLNVRRLFNYLEESILAGTQWVVFEPNDEPLWARLRRTIGAFLVTEWRKGALFGTTPDEAFYVKCDHETNPPEVIDAGQVICDIGVAPVKPAEFVVFRLAQFSGGSGAVDE